MQAQENVTSLLYEFLYFYSMKLLFATQNEHKASEIRALLPTGFELLSLNDIQFTQDIPETAETLEGNALIKANAIFGHTGIPCFADDSGLEVEFLDGNPGVHSARFAGPEKNDRANSEKLLSLLEHSPNRNAQFRTVIAYVDGTEPRYFEGAVKGTILTDFRGNQGFGYDPIFQPIGWNKSFAEVSTAEKNNISHRSLAFNRFLEYLHGVNKI